VFARIGLLKNSVAKANKLLVDGRY